MLPRLQRAFATAGALLTKIPTCHLKYSVRSKFTPSHLVCRRLDFSETDNSPCATASVLPRSLSIRQREKC